MQKVQVVKFAIGKDMNGTVIWRDVDGNSYYTSRVTTGVYDEEPSRDTATQLDIELEEVPSF